MMTSESQEKVGKEGVGQRAQTRDQVPKQRSALLWAMATCGRREDWMAHSRDAMQLQTTPVAVVSS